jgi:F-type H+-transporting ATPase subunit c
MKFWQVLSLVVLVVLMSAAPVLAADPPTGTTTTPTVAPTNWGAGVGAGVGVGLVLIGAGLGLGRIGGSMVESMARQPDKIGQIQVGAIIIAALIEGLAFAALFLVNVALVARA